MEFLGLMVFYSKTHSGKCPPKLEGTQKTKENNEESIDGTSVGIFFARSHNIKEDTKILRAGEIIHLIKKVPNFVAFNLLVFLHFVCKFTIKYINDAGSPKIQKKMIHQHF